MEDLNNLAKEVFRLLGEGGIPAEIIDGFALQHYGYVRNTMDIDVLVADHIKAIELLKANGYEEAGGWFKLKPEGTDKWVDILPGGKRMTGNEVTNPMPQTVSLTPVFAPLRDIVEAKVGVVVSNNSRAVDKMKNSSDVMHLIEINDLPQDFLGAIYDTQVTLGYSELWQKVQEDKQKAKQASADSFSDFFWH